MFYITYSYCRSLFGCFLCISFLVASGLTLPHHHCTAPRALQLQSLVLIEFQCDTDTPLFETLQVYPRDLRGRSTMLLSIAWRPLHLPTPAWAFLCSLH